MQTTKGRSKTKKMISAILTFPKKLGAQLGSMLYRIFFYTGYFEYAAGG